NGDTVQIIDRNRGEYRILEFQLDQGVINTISLPQLKGHYPELFVLDYLTKYPEKIYLATKEGLFIYNQEIEDWKVYSVESGHLKNQPVFSICEDPHDPEILWLGTGSGLHRFNTSTEEVVVFTEKEGLPNDFVYSIQSDDFGNLWIGTNYGLARYNIKADKFRAFNRSDGINGDEFNTFEYSKSPDGTMCFGGIEGNTAFHPKEFLSDSVRSNVVINQIRLFNRLVEHASTDASSEIFTLPHPPELTKEIELTHEESMLTIAFGMIDFGQWERQVYRYRMQGLDDQWIETKEIREATFTNLDAGNYTFEVVGKNSQGNWSLEPTTLKITILPAWWETWWFRSSIGLLLLVIGYVVYKYRLNAILKVERTRNQIAQDLHDEIGSTLSSISLYGAVMKSNEKELSEQNRPILDRIITNVSDIMEKMNDMVWTIKTDNDHMDQVINRMRAFAVEMTEAKDIELHFDVDRSVEQLKLEMDKRKEIYLIFKEVVNNSVKYSQAQHIKIELNEQAKKLTLSIQDDGIGFDPDVKKVNMLGGNGIPGMKRRAERIDAVLSFESEIGIGTKVALSMKLNH
ncbi:MAG: triple tyrosine motif-containing protein, partial [Bacteroidota bacterium]